MKKKYLITIKSVAILCLIGIGFWILNDNDGKSSSSKQSTNVKQETTNNIKKRQDNSNTDSHDNQKNDGNNDSNDESNYDNDEQIPWDFVD